MTRPTSLQILGLLVAVTGCFQAQPASHSSSCGSGQACSASSGESSSNESSSSSSGNSSSGASSSTGVTSVVALPPDPAVIRLSGSGSTTTSTIVFELKNITGAPVADGVAVQFSILGASRGATIAPTSAVTANGTGRVQTLLSSGDQQESVVVVATVGALTAQSTPVAITGPLVNGAELAISCPHRGIAGFQGFGLQNTCTVYAADFNHAFVPNTTISLLTEAGAVPPLLPIQDMNSSSADFEYQASCPFPKDVAPLPGEFFEEDAGYYDVCAPNSPVVHRTRNPRDGRVTIVAYVLGEQCYNDLMDSGHYDPGDYAAPCDTGDPFVDENDNGKWDPPCSSNPSDCDPMIPEGEPYVDSPGGDGGYHGPDGTWHGWTYIWVSTSVVWTDIWSRVTSSTTTTPGSFQPIPYSGLQLGVDYGSASPCATYSATQYVTYADSNGNIPAAVGADDLISITGTNATPAITVLGLQQATEQWNDLITLRVSLTQGENAYHFTNGGSLYPSLLPTFEQNWDNYYHDESRCSMGEPALPYTIGISVDRTLGDGAEGRTTMTYEDVSFEAAYGSMTDN